MQVGVIGVGSALLPRLQKAVGFLVVPDPISVGRGAARTILTLALPIPIVVVLARSWTWGIPLTTMKRRVCPSSCSSMATERGVESFGVTGRLGVLDGAFA